MTDGLVCEPEMTPMLVMARVAGGVGLDARWGTALDGLLAAAIWAERKAELRGQETATVPLAAQHTPEDLPLPLARCESGGMWHWAATFAEPVTPLGVEEGTSDVRWMHTAFDQRHAGQVADPAALPESIPAHYGRFLKYRLPLVVTLCREVTWRAVGRPAHVKALLDTVTAFGKKRAHGEGHVLRWSVEPFEVPRQQWWDWAHLHYRGGGLGRTAPAECLHDRSGVRSGGFGIGGIRPPYIHPERRAQLMLPVPLDGGW